MIFCEYLLTESGYTIISDKTENLEEKYEEIYYKQLLKNLKGIKDKAIEDIEGETFTSLEEWISDYEK